MNEYNGWTNYETWSVKLIIDNDQAIYNSFRDITKEVIKCNPDETEQMNLMIAIVKHWLEGTCPTTNNPLWQQILSKTINETINIYEIANSLLEDHKEEVA